MERDSWPIPGDAKIDMLRDKRANMGARDAT